MHKIWPITKRLCLIIIVLCTIIFLVTRNQKYVEKAKVPLPAYAIVTPGYIYQDTSQSLSSPLRKKLVDTKTHMSARNTMFFKRSQKGFKRKKKTKPLSVPSTPENYSLVCISSSGHKMPDKPTFLTVKPRRRDEFPAWHLHDKYVTFPEMKCTLHKLITVYDKLVTGKVPPRDIGGFNVSFSRKFNQRKYNVVESTAYFLGRNIGSSRIDNLYHFLVQIFIPLYHFMKSTGTLHQQKDVAAFYFEPYGRCPGKFVPFKTQYLQPFFDILHIPDHFMGVYEGMPNPENVCYKQAVFASDLQQYLNESTIEAITYFQEQYGINNSPCKVKPKMSILQRQVYRKIVNVDEMKMAAIDAGYSVDIVILEKFTIQEQAQIAYCTDVLVGVTGAGLVWSYFMKNNSNVIEIAWPKLEWPFFFSSQEKYASLLRHTRPLHIVQLDAEDCVMDPAVVNLRYEQMFMIPGNFTEAESLAIINDRRNYNFAKNGYWSLGKNCDAKINIQDFKNALSKLTV